MIKTYAVPFTLNEAQGGLSPSDPVAKTSNDSRLSQSQVSDTTTSEAKALLKSASKQDAGASSASRKTKKITNQNKSPANYCECSASTFANTLTQFSEPDLHLKLMQVGDLPKTFTISNTSSKGTTCGLKELSDLCGPLKFKFTIGDSNQEINEFPYQVLDWKENALEFSLKPTLEADFMDHLVTLQILPQSYPELSQVFKNYFRIAPPQKAFQNFEEIRKLRQLSNYQETPDKIYGDLEIPQTSAIPTQASSEAKQDPALSASTTATECDSADCLNSQLESATFADLEKCSASDCIIEKDSSAKLVCKGITSCEEALDAAVARMKTTIVPMLDMDSPTDPITSEADDVHDQKFTGSQDTNDQADQKKTVAPCTGYIDTLANDLMRFAESILLMHVNELHYFTISKDNSGSNENDWSRFCGLLTFQFFNSFTDEEILLPFKGLLWQEHLHRFTFAPTNDDLGDHSITIMFLLQSDPTIYRAVLIPFSIAPRQNNYSHRNLLSYALLESETCKGSVNNFNLLNQNVEAQQNEGCTATGTCSTNLKANAGCDGILQKNYPLPSVANPEPASRNIVHVEPPAPETEAIVYWVAVFQQSVLIQSILYIMISQQLGVKILVGYQDDPQKYLDNPECKGGLLIYGGWLDCGLTGRYLVVTSENGFLFEFTEVMAYSQYYIHHKALSSVLSSTLILPEYPNDCFADYVMQSRIQTFSTSTFDGFICSWYETTPTLTVTMKADVMIECVLLTPIDELVYVENQMDVEVWIVNSAGVTYLCGTLADYNKYTEVTCNRIGNKIIITKPYSLQLQSLQMAGLSILSSCDCLLTQLNPALIFAAKPLASITTVNTKSTAAPVIITLNKQMPDTVSSACGQADGFTQCGPRGNFEFADKTTGKLITFPYQGFEINQDQSALTLNPAKAAAISVLTVTIKLVNYQTVTYTQEITVIVEQLAQATITLNATINQEAFIELPKLDAQFSSYVVTSKQTFEASVDGNKLRVLSKNQSDVGAQFLDLVATSSTSQSNYILKVKVVFQAPSKLNDTQNQTYVKFDSKLTTTRENLTASNVTSIKEAETFLGTAACNTTKTGEISCVGPDGSKFQIGVATGTFLFGNQSKAQVAPLKRPILTISKVNTKGILAFQFSEPVGLEALNIPVPQERKLRKGGGGSSKSGGSSTSKSKKTSQDYDYKTNLLNLLSDKHLKITIKTQSSNEPIFTWHAVNITSTQVLIQIYLQDPLQISHELGVLDTLIIQILPPALIYMRSLETGAITEDPLRIVNQNLPPQVILGPVIEAAETASENLKAVGQTSTLTNVFVQLVLSQSMAQMWSMVNAQQIILTYQLLNLQMPGNVILVITNLAEIADFNLFPVNDFLEWLFSFTPTESPGVGFETMGIQVKSVILYLGMAFLMMMLMGLEYLLYGFALACKKYDKIMSKIEEYLKPGLFNGLFYIFMIETYLDWAISSALRLEQPMYETGSDYFDLILASVGAINTIVLPFYVYFYLQKNINQLGEEYFKSKHGALYDGFTTENASRRSASIKMSTWFLIRRLLTAVNLVYLRDQTIWFQLTFNMLLSFIDVCIKFDLSPYESKVAGFMDKFNDFFVLTCAYFPYLFTDLIPSPEDKYFIGWLYNGTIGIMVAANVFILFKTAFESLKEKISEMILEYNHKKASKVQNERRKKQEKLLELVQSGTIDAVSYITLKPRAPQNGVYENQKSQLELFQAMKRQERKQAKSRAIAKKYPLAEISERDESLEISNSSRSQLVNDLEAQIVEESSSSQYQSDWQSSQQAQQTPKSQVSYQSFDEFGVSQPVYSYQADVVPAELPLESQKIEQQKQQQEEFQIREDQWTLAREQGKLNEKNRQAKFALNVTSYNEFKSTVIDKEQKKLDLIRQDIRRRNEKFLNNRVRTNLLSFATRLQASLYIEEEIKVPQNDEAEARQKMLKSTTFNYDLTSGKSDIESYKNHVAWLNYNFVDKLKRNKD